MNFKSFLNKYKIFFSSSFIILIIIRILLIQVPLFKNLDLELSILFSLIFSLFSSYSSLFLLNRKVKVLYVTILNLMMVFFLFLIFLFIEIFFFRCPVTTGVLFFPVFVFTSTLFGLSIGLIFSTFGKKNSYIFLTVFILILFFYSLIEYYFEPHLFLFNPLVIFFPGLVYNEIFELDLKILYYVVMITSASSLIIINYLLSELTNRKYYDKYNLHLKIVSLFLFSILFITAEETGLNTSQYRLLKFFPTKIKTENFDLYFERKDLEPIELNIYKYVTEFHYKELVRFTGLRPNKFQVFIFKDNRSKRKLLGDEVADFTKPWLRQIFVTERSFEQTVKHELAHIFLGEISNNIFKVAGKYNLGLIEGGAMALEWEWLENSPFYYSVLINHFVNKFNSSDFFSNYSFATRQSYLSYLMSGSFCRYLIDNYGIRSFLIFYQSGDFELTYNKSLEIEFEKFINNLKEIKPETDDSLKAKILFGGKSFVEKNCPRSLARLHKQAMSFFNKNDFENAERIFLKIYNKRKDVESFANLIRIKFYQKKFDEVIRLFNSSEITKELNGFSSVQSLIFYYLSLRKLNFINEANEIFIKLNKLNISTDWTNYIELMSFLINHPELIDQLITMNYNDFNRLLLKKFPDEPVVLKTNLENINSENLDLIFRNSIDNFWLLKKCFFRYLKLGNFVKARAIIETIKKRNLIKDEVQSYQFNLMNYVYDKLTKDGF